MKTINLRDFYPYYQNDVFVDVPDDLATQLGQWERDENTYHRKRHRHRAHYSLDGSRGVEGHILFIAASPDERYEKTLTHEQLLAALYSLPDKQVKRIYLHCILGLSKAEIARTEGVGKATVGQSINSGLRKLESLVRNFL